MTIMDGDVKTGREENCLFCRRFVIEVRDSDSGCLDWQTEDGDFGCDDGPLTGEDGVDSHLTLSGAREIVLEYAAMYDTLRGLLGPDETRKLLQRASASKPGS